MTAMQPHPHPHPHPHAPQRQQGIVLIGVLVLLSLAALAAVQYSQRRVHERQREAEEELLYIGEQYRLAIESYWRNSPGKTRVLPTRLEELVLDPRFPQPRRHIRKLYADPLDASSAWGLVKQGNALIGVYSQAEGVPFRISGFDEANVGFDGATSYADWRFKAKVFSAAPTGGARPGSPAPSPAPKPGSRSAAR
jgi:type II secretory pathway pseudopilin PulG